MAALEVEVVYALPEAQQAVKVTLAAPATLRDAIVASGLLERYPEIDLARQKVGVFGKVMPADARVSDGDRVEIYRALASDPKEARRRKASAKR